MKFFETFVLCIVYQSFLQMSCAFKTGNIIFNRGLFSPSFLLKNIAQVSLSNCQKACKSRYMCTSISYNRRFKGCQLHTWTPGDSPALDSSKGWLYMEKEEMQVNVGQYETNNCLPGETCNENGNTITCAYKECTNILPGERKGNLNGVGSRKVISCTDGYWQNHTSTSVCNDNGLWSIPDVCRKGFCSHPEFDGNVIWIQATLMTDYGYINVNESNANLSDFAFTNASQLEFNCSGNLNMVQSPIKACVDGWWSSLPQCFELRLEQFCLADQDCEIPELPHSSEMKCTNSTCDCPFGYSYSYSQFRCFERCPNDDFANTFRKTDGVVTMGYNTHVVWYISEETCIQRCIDETGFVCRSFEYLLSGGNYRCNMQTNVVADVPDSLEYFGAYYQRDCV